MDDSDDLPLRDGILRWCNQSLVQSVIAAEAEFKAAPPDPEGPSWFRGDPLEVVRAWRPAANARSNLRHRAELAWQALIADFRALVATEAVVMSGLRTKPSLAMERSDLPPAWAFQMRFNLTAARVTVADVVFADIMVRRPSSNLLPHPAAHALPAEPNASGNVHVLGAMVPPDEDDSRAAPPFDDAASVKARAKPGRKSTNELIKQALLSRWDEVTTEAERAASNRPNFSRLAKSIRKQLMREKPARNEKEVPQEDTIRRNLPAIYDELLGETRRGK